MEIHDLENNLLFVYDKWDKESNTPYINLTNNKLADPSIFVFLCLMIVNGTNLPS